MKQILGNDQTNIINSNSIRQVKLSWNISLGTGNVLFDYDDNFMIFYSYPNQKIFLYSYPDELKMLYSLNTANYEKLLMYSVDQNQDKNFFYVQT